MGSQRFRKIKTYAVLLVAIFISSITTKGIEGIKAQETPSWHQYVVGPGSNQVFPLRIVSTTGNVTNAAGLLNNGTKGTTRLSRTDLTQPVSQIIFDFGLNVVGQLQVFFVGASTNKPGVRLAFSETMQYLQDVSDFSRSDNCGSEACKITPGTDQYVVPAQPVKWVDTYGCEIQGNKVCHDGLHGFRYLKLSLDALASDAPYSEATGYVEIESIVLNFTGYVGTPETFQGWFECSDADLNRFWYQASYTNELITDTFRSSDVDIRQAASPSLEGKLVLLDGAKRDRDSYVGDLAVSARTAYLTHDVGIAARNVLADLADHQRDDGWIPPASIFQYTLPLFDYPLWWATTSWDYILYTGDVGYAKSYYANLVKLLDGWCPSVTNAQGLLEKGLSGTAQYGDYGFLPRSGVVTYYNAIYVLALKAGASIANVLGQGADAEKWQTRAEMVAAAINDNLWDAGVGAYLDSATGSPVKHGQDGNGLAILAGVADDSRAQSALSYLSRATALPYGNSFMDDDSHRVYAFISYFDIQARFLTGNADSAIEEIKRLYGWMASNDPFSTFWEGIGPDGSLYEGAFTSAAHGWSTGVLPALTNYLLGAIPTAPGYQTWSVKPHPGNVTWARGQVPTPHGPLLVSWHLNPVGTDVRGFELVLTAPVGTSGDVSVPVNDNLAVVHADGLIAWDGTRGSLYNAKFENNFVTLQGISEGNHTFTVQENS